MLGEGGSKARTYAEVLDALYPLAARIRVYGDKEIGRLRRDRPPRQPGEVRRSARRADPDAALRRRRLHAQPPGRARLRHQDAARKRRRGPGQAGDGDVDVRRGHPYGRPSQGTVAGLERHHARRRPQALRVALHARSTDRRRRGRLPRRLRRGVREALRDAARQGAAAAASCRPRPCRKRNQLLIVEKEARANAISIGRPLAITRKDPDFYPLTVARSYLGEHRTFNGVLMNHLREMRGLNYGDYAYVENFIQDGWTTFPLPNIPRRQQHFEIWLRPVPPHNSLFALRAALYETDKLIRDGIPPGRLRGDAHLPGELLQPVGAGRVAPARLRDRRGGHRQGRGQGAAGAAAQDEEGRRRPGGAQASRLRWADDRHRRRQRARRSPTR